MITEDKVLAALRNVDDPDLKKDVVTLGMIQDLKIQGKKVSFRLVLTTPACPLKEMIRSGCVNAIHTLVDAEAEIDIKFDSMVTTQHLQNKQVLSGVKNIIAVASGKGGVGKSTVATNLAIALGLSGAKVGLLDADIYGPSLPLMMGLKGMRPDIREVGQKITIIPFEKYGIKAMSVGLLIEESQALVWRGPMITSALKQLLLDVAWDDLDYLIVDMPPGTGDIYLTLAQQFPLSAAVIVTTPQEVAVADTRKSIEMFRIPAINIPILGLVENMAYFTPEELPQNKYYIFGRGGADQLAEQYGIPVLARLPLFAAVAEQADMGTPAVMGDNPLLQTEIMQLAEKVAQQLSIVNGTGPELLINS
jgi:ATP-binding protein involved in chromosome partitioning